MTDHPINDVPGLATSANVSKTGFTAYVKERTRLRVQNVAEVTSSNFSDAIGLDYGGLPFDRDLTDTTSAHDGVDVLVDAVGTRFIRIEIGEEGPTGPGYGGTSTTSLTIAGSGSKVFTTQAGLAYQTGARIRATSLGTGAWMEGLVTTYTGTTLTVTMDLNSGSGTRADWRINIAGERGTPGSVGPSGASSFTVCRVCATTNIVIASALENGDTVDGVVLATGNRVLLTGQTAPAENGVYTVPASGAAPRDTAFDTFGELAGSYFSIQEGTAKADTLWRCASDSVGTINVSSLSITEFISAATALMQGLHAKLFWADEFIPNLTSGAQISISETVSNDNMLVTLDFNQTTQEIATLNYKPPKKWNKGTITFRFGWTADAGAGTFELELDGVAISNDDPLDAARGTAVGVVDTLIATGDMHVSDTSTAVTISGTPADGDTVSLRIKRDTTNDTLSGDARLLWVETFWTVNATTDA